MGVTRARLVRLHDDKETARNVRVRRVAHRRDRAIARDDVAIDRRPSDDRVVIASIARDARSRVRSRPIAGVRGTRATTRDATVRVVAATGSAVRERAPEFSGADARDRGRGAPAPGVDDGERRETRGRAVAV